MSYRQGSWCQIQRYELCCIRVDNVPVVCQKSEMDVSTIIISLIVTCICTGRYCTILSVRLYNDTNNRPELLINGVLHSFLHSITPRTKRKPGTVTARLHW